MLKKFLNLSLFFAFAIGASLSSCNKDELSTTTENFTNEAMEGMQRDGNCGKLGCYELVFPITVQFADESTATAASMDDLKTQISAWKEANPDATERPTFAFPIEVVSDEGELISVANPEELRELKSSCRKTGHHRGGKGHKGGERCFSLVFPLNIVFPDETTVAVADRSEAKTALREWKTANPDAETRPELQFPVTVEMEDGTTQEVADKDALKALKDSCSS